MTVIADVLEEIRMIILNSQVISDFCQNNYNRGIKVFFGADERDLPKIENCPFVLLDRGRARFEEKTGIRDIICDFYLFICIYQEQIESDGHGITYTGIKQIEELFQLIRQEIRKNASNYVMFLEEEVPSPEEITIRQYPVYLQIEKAQVRVREKNN